MKEKDSIFLKKMGGQILQIRLDKSLSQEDVSFRCDVDRAKISKLETGSANCNITTLADLAKGLDVTLKELLDFS